MATRKIGRDAETELFNPMKEAEKDKKGSTLETIKIAPKPHAKKQEIVDCGATFAQPLRL